MYALSFFSVIYVIAQRVSGSGDASTVEQNQTYPFSSVVFASWDFHLRSKNAARNLQSAIRKQIGEMLQDVSWEQKTLTVSQKLMKGLSIMQQITLKRSAFLMSALWAILQHDIIYQIPWIWRNSVCINHKSRIVVVFRYDQDHWNPDSVACHNNTDSCCSVLYNRTRGFPKHLLW